MPSTSRIDAKKKKAPKFTDLMLDFFLFYSPKFLPPLPTAFTARSESTNRATSVRIRNGAPSRKECVASSQMTKGNNKLVHPSHHPEGTSPEVYTFMHDIV